MLEVGEVALLGADPVARLCNGINGTAVLCLVTRSLSYPVVSLFNKRWCHTWSEAVTLLSPQSCGVCLVHKRGSVAASKLLQLVYASIPRTSRVQRVLISARL